jgi:hypothetical protein
LTYNEKKKIKIFLQKIFWAKKKSGKEGKREEEEDKNKMIRYLCRYYFKKSYFDILKLWKNLFKIIGTLFFIIVTLWFLSSFFNSVLSDLNINNPSTSQTKIEVVTKYLGMTSEFTQNLIWNFHYWTSFQIVKPIYLFGRGFGWKSKPEDDICAELTGTASSTWRKTPDDCMKIIENEILSYAVICDILIISFLIYWGWWPKSTKQHQHHHKNKNNNKNINHRNKNKQQYKSHNKNDNENNLDRKNVSVNTKKTKTTINNINRNETEQNDIDINRNENQMEIENKHNHNNQRRNKNGLNINNNTVADTNLENRIFVDPIIIFTNKDQNTTDLSYKKSIKNRIMQYNYGNGM